MSESKSEKYTPEKLAAMRSIGFAKGGRTRHNNAGVPIKEVVSDTGDRRETVDANNAKIIEHADGRQDVELNPKPIAAVMTQKG